MGGGGHLLYGEQPGGRGAPVVRSYIHALWARVQTARPDGVVGDPGRSRRGAPAVGGAVVDDGSVDNASPPPRPPSPPPTVPAVADEPQTAGATGRHAPHVPHCTAHCAQWRGGGGASKTGRDEDVGYNCTYGRRRRRHWAPGVGDDSGERRRGGGGARSRARGRACQHTPTATRRGRVSPSTGRSGAVPPRAKELPALDHRPISRPASGSLKTQGVRGRGRPRAAANTLRLRSVAAASPTRGCGPAVAAARLAPAADLPCRCCRTVSAGYSGVLYMYVWPIAEE